MESTLTLTLKNVNQIFTNKDESIKLFTEDINLILKPNSATLLYGGSGSGKTTLFNILIALNKPSSGDIYWGKKQISSLQEANKFRANYMSVIFSNFSFIYELSVRDNIMLGASLLKIEDAEDRLTDICSTLLNFQGIDDNIDLTNLLTKQSVAMLSNGQKEIVALASCLLLKSRFFIADEMLRSFPDQTKILLLKRLIEYFKKNKIGFFYITHWPQAAKLFQESGFESHIFNIENKKLHKKEVI